jgi:hypothetical protein
MRSFLRPAILLLGALTAAAQTPPASGRPPALESKPEPSAAPLPPAPPEPAFHYELEWNDHMLQFQDRIAEIKARIGEMELAPLAKITQDMAWAPQILSLKRANSDDRIYEAGQRALEERRWDEALEDFNQVSSRGGPHADGAWYWKAYALNKLGRREESMAALGELRKAFPNSRWLDDAKALELEIKQASGRTVAPENESDDDLKLLALNGIMQSDPDRAFPLLEKLLHSAQSPKLKRNALYVLAANSSPRSQQLLEQIAKGQGNPDLQVLAIRYYGERRRQNPNVVQVLFDIYASSNDPAVKRAALATLDKDRLLQIAKAEKTQELRLEAVRRLASLPDAQTEVWQLYQSEAAPEIRMQILEVLPSSGNLDRFLDVAKTEKDSRLRRFAVQHLASPRAAGTGQALAALYRTEQDSEVRRAIVDALYGQRNAKDLIQIARNEKDPKMKQRIVERIANMKSPEGNEYLMEILR